MLKEQFDAQLTKCLQSQEGCSVKAFQSNQKWDGIKYELTKEFNPNLVKEVILNFSSGTPPADMIKQISPRLGSER